MGLECVCGWPSKVPERNAQRSDVHAIIDDADDCVVRVQPVNPEEPRNSISVDDKDFEVCCESPECDLQRMNYANPPARGALNSNESVPVARPRVDREALGSWRR
jgi:hypothetical protein